MASVVPVEDDDGIEYYDEDEPQQEGFEPDSPRQSKELNEEEQARQMKFLLKQMAINRRLDFYDRIMSYEFYKESMAWFLDTAACNLKIGVRICLEVAYQTFHVTHVHKLNHLLHSSKR